MSPNTVNGKQSLSCAFDNVQIDHSCAAAILALNYHLSIQRPCLNPLSSVISTFTPMQNPTGGMGGGHGQLSHCASSYATVLALAMVGGEEAFELIDREAM